MGKNIAIAALILLIPLGLYFSGDLFKSPIEKCTSRMLAASDEYSEADSRKACQCIEDAKKSAPNKDKETLLAAIRPCTDVLMKSVVIRQCESSKKAEEEGYDSVDCECYYAKSSAATYVYFKANNFKPPSSDQQQEIAAAALSDCTKK